MSDLRLAAFVSHPIQYQTPFFQSLARRLDLTVFYGLAEEQVSQQSAGFGRDFDWDVPLLEGYRYRFVRNGATSPGLGFFGIDWADCRADLEACQADAVLVFGWNRRATWQCIQACRDLGIPVYMRGDSQLPMRSRLVNLLKRPVLAAALSRIDFHLAPGRRNAEYLKWLGVPDRRIHHVPHYVDDERFARARTERVSERPRLLFVGRLIDWKRPQWLIHAAAALGLRATIVGDGPIRERLEQLAGSLGADVTFRGFVNQGQLPEVYAEHDLLVLPSKGMETWGLVVNEAAASGCASIVAEEVGCAPEVARFFGDEHVIRDHKALVASLGRLAANWPGVRAQAQRSALQFSASHSLQTAVDRFISALEAR